ncbi:hypothetical protein HDU87_002637 [Geranomyces variabilis]|uniref:Uncharacterized protein n=1 Tax=Geranomyces variabilis TaxID=109894 RepID=A0AAD5TTQ5_9FUNG|nr:hypothetical protein HDU87_002637 [Geranomyces variabilis]
MQTPPSASPSTSEDIENGLGGAGSDTSLRPRSYESVASNLCAPSSPEPQYKPRVKLPLALVLLSSMIIVAAAIAVPVSILAYRGATDTVNDIILVLKKNYVRQVQERVASITSIVYERIQNNADNFTIRRITDSINNNTIDFLAYPDLLYSYEKSVERSDFLLAAGFCLVGGRDCLLLARNPLPGLICKANLTDTVYGRDCSGLYVDRVLPRSITYSLETITKSSASPDPPIATTGLWANSIFWLIFDPLSVPPVFSGVYGYWWAQWKGYKLGTRDPDPAVGPTGWQEIASLVSKYTDVLREIRTTPNTAIAIWLTQSGELIATNGEFQTLNLDTIVKNEGAGYSGSTYRPTEYPNTYISSAAKYLLGRYGNYSTFPNTTSHQISIPDGDSAFVETRALDDDNGLSWTLLIAIPENDLITRIAASRKRVVATCIGVGIAMVMFAAGITVVIGLPLRKLTRIMTEATAMNFTSVRDGYLNKSSWITELARMEQVFATMLFKFAAAVDRNRLLARHSGPSPNASPFATPPQQPTRPRLLPDGGRSAYIDSQEVL